MLLTKVAVMSKVCSVHRSHVGTTGFRGLTHSSVNEEVVDEEIRHPIRCYADTHPQRDTVWNTEHDECHRSGGEEQDEEVIPLPERAGRLVMRFVNIPQQSMHDVLVEPTGEELHPDE